MHLLSAAEMRNAEDRAIGSGAVTGLELMERAGAGAVATALQHWPALAAGGHAAIFCGPGNNGGDGFVVARLLALRGLSISLWLLGHPDALPADAARNHDIWVNSGTVGDLAAASDETLAAGADLAVDALFGTGLSRPVTLPLDRIFLNAPRVLSLDIPSGLCADSGRVIGGAEGSAVTADLTVTFHRAKLGHYLSEGPAHCGTLAVCDIGLPDSGTR
ncbi:NAD(P)H-hydrate epimerase [Sulfitobacter sp. D35]|uniref:NAD(P)H-hydrate epimerase n=1 Tax=Sulfitobacter sp. D35 TaxID=3083252 RepID=UPI00296E298E|nr:NAD(P)H-hydrate epimerase [Sulfitobacter sp. D35]MDW4496690.1 NAD(P)H-hydrate epimerase [Sulfitobacter sp. D35]